MRIGENVYVSSLEYKLIDFSDPLKAVQKLSVLAFTQQVLATHSITGRASNAHLGQREAKPQLDPVKVGVITSMPKI